MNPFIWSGCWTCCSYSTALFVFIGMLVYLYFQVLKNLYSYSDIVHKDILNAKVFELHYIGSCSWWPITHFCSFTIITFFWPECWFVHFVLGLLWEMFEKFYKIMIENSYKFSRTRKTNQSIEYINWWDSSMKDILFNSAGILIGYVFGLIIF